MIDYANIEEMRPLLAAMCSAGELRAQPPNIGTDRHKWWPFSVLDRASLSRFSDAGAWECIAECLTRGVAIKYQPPTPEFDDHAYVMIDTETGLEDIYIKIVICRKMRKLLGVSFHYARQ